MRKIKKYKNIILISTYILSFILAALFGYRAYKVDSSYYGSMIGFIISLFYNVTFFTINFRD